GRLTHRVRFGEGRKPGNLLDECGWVRSGEFDRISPCRWSSELGTAGAETERSAAGSFHFNPRIRSRFRLAPLTLTTEAPHQIVRFCQPPTSTATPNRQLPKRADLLPLGIGGCRAALPRAHSALEELGHSAGESRDVGVGTDDLCLAE